MNQAILEENPVMVNYGVIGLGFMGVMHMKALRQVRGACLKAICNPSGRRLDGDFAGVAGNIGGGEVFRLDMSTIDAYRGFDELLKSDVDVIDICTPTPTHKELVIRALEAGKHVICEKPMARDSASAAEMAESAKRCQKLLMPAMCLRFWPEWAYIKRLKESGIYGRIEAARFRRVAEPPAWGQNLYFDGRQSGGGLFDLHIHDTDFVQFLFGKPKSVYSKGFSKVSGAVDHVVTQYNVEGGSVVSAEGSWAMTPGFGFNMAYTVQFEKATLDYDFSRTDEPLRLFLDGGEKHIIRLSGQDGYIGELQHFTDSVNAGRALSVVSPEDGIISVKICEAEERSVLSGAVENVI